METQPHLSAIIPAFNEEARLPRSLPLLASELRKLGHTFEIIVVDDGSTDGTHGYLLQAKKEYPELRFIRNECNRGKGSAVRDGILSAKGFYSFFTDADLATPISEVGRLLITLQNDADVAIGIRVDDSTSEIHRGLVRGLMGQVFRVLVRVLLLPDIEDSQCGFKAFRTDVARELFEPLNEIGFLFDIEVLRRARFMKKTIAQVPVSFSDIPGSKVRIYDVLSMLFGLVRLRFDSSYTLTARQS